MFEISKNAKRQNNFWENMMFSISKGFSFHIDFKLFSLSEQLQNSTLEERVELLEIQVVVIQDEVSDLETNIDFLFDEKVIQDEKLLDLEQETEEIDEQLVVIGDRLDIIDDQLEVKIEIRFIHSSMFKRYKHGEMTSSCPCRVTGYNSCPGFPSNGPRRERRG